MFSAGGSVHAELEGTAGGRRCHKAPGLVLGTLLHPRAPPRLPHFQLLPLAPVSLTFLAFVSLSGRR